MDVNKILHWVLAALLGVFLTFSGYVVGASGREGVIEVEKVVEKVVEKEVVSDGELAEALGYILQNGETFIHVTVYGTYSREAGSGTERRISFQYKDGELSTEVKETITSDKPAHLSFINLVKKTKLLHNQ